jgi:hypothetical protein
MGTSVGLNRYELGPAMTVTLNLKPELEAGNFAQARASGMTVEAYLLFVVECAVHPAIHQK